MSLGGKKANFTSEEIENLKIPLNQGTAFNSIIILLSVPEFSDKTPPLKNAPGGRFFGFLVLIYAPGRFFALKRSIFSHVIFRKYAPGCLKIITLHLCIDHYPTVTALRSAFFGKNGAVFSGGIHILKEK